MLSNGANPNNLFSEHDGGISAFHIAVGVENDLEFTRLFLNYNGDVYLQYDFILILTYSYIILIITNIL